ncbi:hypothetical protein ACLMAJ_02700 [Nocardia sp. KC 131]|uniref:hypothetical protein n=1 Tax=Nocardia arseniciresistens TaxID=3392119 RepID=UPI00398EFC86
MRDPTTGAFVKVRVTELKPFTKDFVFTCMPPGTALIAVEPTLLTIHDTGTRRPLYQSGTASAGFGCAPALFSGIPGLAVRCQSIVLESHA